MLKAKLLSFLHVWLWRRSRTEFVRGLIRCVLEYDEEDEEKKNNGEVVGIVDGEIL